MRVLFWCGSFWPKIGGVEVRAAKLLPALRQKGFDLIVVTGQVHPECSAGSLFQGIPVYRFPFFEIGKDVNQAMKIRQQITNLKRSFAPDLIHRNGIGADTFFDLRNANSHPVPLLVTLINDLRANSITKDTVVGRLLHTADWVSTVSSAALAQARELVPDLVSRSSVIHSGLELGAFKPIPPPTDCPRLICLGRLVEQKGIDIALNALVSVIRRYPQARMVIAGDGPDRAQLEQQAVRLGISGAVEFLGWVPPPQVPTIISSANIIIIPSRWEGLPNVALQAGLMARPVVGSRVGGLPEIVEHQQTGILVEPENGEALARAIIGLIQNPKTAIRMGEAAHAKIQTEFSWNQYVDAYAALYRQLMRHGHRQSSVALSQ